jgi:hypothetical protein
MVLLITLKRTNPKPLMKAREAVPSLPKPSGKICLGVEVDSNLPALFFFLSKPRYMNDGRTG